MAVEADRVVVALIGDTSNLDRNVGQSARQFGRSMSSIEASATRAERSIVTSTGTIGNAQRNLGRQIADIGTQLSSGASPFLILSQQAPQVADALADVGGRAGRVASFFAGPWGAALLAAGSVVGMLIPKLFDLGNAHDAAKEAAEAQSKAEQQLSDILQGAVDQGERARIAALGLAQAHVFEARAALNSARAQLQLARARATAAAATERAAPGTMQIPGRGAASSAELLRLQQIEFDAAERGLGAAELKQRNLEAAAELARGIEAQRDKTKSDKSAAAAQRRAEAAARRAAREAERNTDQQRQGIAELLRGRAELAAAEAELTSDSRVMDEALRQRIESERQIARAEIQDQEGLSSGQRQELLAINDRIAAARLRKVNIDEAQRYLEEETKLLQAGLGNERDVASAQLDLADTTEQRRALALRLLDIAIRQERADLEAVLASQQATEVQKQIARKRLESLDTLAGLQRAGIERDNEAPGARYLRDLRTATAELDRSAEEVAVDGFERLNDELADAIMGTRSLGDVFKNVANQIIADLVRIAIRKQVVGPLAESLFGAGGGGGGSGVGSLLTSIFGRASGGYVAPNSVTRVNEGRGGVELLRMGPQGGQVIPLGQTRAASPGANVTIIHAPQTIIPGAITTPQLMAEIDRRNRDSIASAAPLIADAGAKKALTSLTKSQRFGTP
jgi:hypothetical protein